MSEFVLLLRKNIRDKEISSLSLSGFNAPNDFSIIKLKEIIKAGKYPENNFKEYCFGIYETPFEEIEVLQPYLKIYIYTIFLYSYFKVNGCIDTLDEIYLYLFLRAILKVKIDKALVLLFLKKLKFNTSASTHFLELASLILSCDNIQCKEFKIRFLASFKNDGCTIYDDFYDRWMNLVTSCTNQKLKKCINLTLNEALKEQNQWKDDSCYRFRFDLFLPT